MILSYLDSIPAEEYLPNKHERKPAIDQFKPVWGFEPTSRPVRSSVDYLRVTTSNEKDFQDFTRKFLPFLRGVGLTFTNMNKGMNGYTDTWQIQYEGQVCGHICADKGERRMGGMVDLTGEACQLLQVRWDLWCYLMAGVAQYGLKVKRLDIASDFKGSVWDKFGVNILGLLHRVHDGMLDSSAVSGGARAKVHMIGPWADITVNQVLPSGYDPKKMCKGGLTINVGSSSSRSHYCIYEKGKQKGGDNPERYDGSLDGWVRIERRFSSGSGRSEWKIDYDFLVNPDAALVYQCDGLSGFIGDWESFQKSQGVEVASVSAVDVDLERVGLLKGLSLKRTALHVARQSARFFKTLEVIGVDVLEFVNVVKSDEYTKGFNPEIYERFSVGAGDDVMSFLRSQYA